MDRSEIEKRIDEKKAKYMALVGKHGTAAVVRLMAAVIVDLRLQLEKANGAR